MPIFVHMNRRRFTLVPPFPLLPRLGFWLRNNFHSKRICFSFLVTVLAVVVVVPSIDLPFRLASGIAQLLFILSPWPFGTRYVAETRVRDAVSLLLPWPLFYMLNQDNSLALYPSLSHLCALIRARSSEIKNFSL